MFIPGAIITLVVGYDAGPPAGRVIQGIRHSSFSDSYLNWLTCDCNRRRILATKLCQHEKNPKKSHVNMSFCLSDNILRQGLI